MTYPTSSPLKRRFWGLLGPRVWTCLEVSREGLDEANIYSVYGFTL